MQCLPHTSRFACRHKALLIGTEYPHSQRSVAMCIRDYFSVLWPPITHDVRHGSLLGKCGQVQLYFEQNSETRTHVVSPARSSIWKPRSTTTCCMRRFTWENANRELGSLALLFCSWSFESKPFPNPRACNLGSLSEPDRNGGPRLGLQSQTHPIIKSCGEAHSSTEIPYCCNV